MFLSGKAFGEAAPTPKKVFVGSLKTVVLKKKKKSMKHCLFIIEDQTSPIEEFTIHQL